MYRHNQRQLQFENFSLSFGGKLRSDNRWVKQAKFVPWEEFEPEYAKTLASQDKGPPAMSVRVALETPIIKERLGTCDEETVEQISENPFLQYFLGFESFKMERPFDPSILVHFRRRLSMDIVCKINERINQKAFEHEVYRQQRWMFDNNQNRIDDRIVSISQAHVRPIKRGKAKASTEFGAKISASLVQGHTFLDHLSWDNFNESQDLKSQIKSYHERFGCYPESVHADKINRTRDNIKYCMRHNIRLSGPALGRPPKEKELQKEIRKQPRQDELDRIPIEGKFGQGKRCFSLSKIMCKLPETSASAVAKAFLVLNLEKWLAAILFYLISLLGGYRSQNMELFS